MQLLSWLRLRACGLIRTRPSRNDRPMARCRPRLEALERRDVPSTLTVTSTADNGLGSLRDEIAAAHSGDTIGFDPSLAGQTIALTSGELAISKSLAIQGPGAGLLAISGTGPSRVFDVTAAGAVVTLTGLTIEGGSASGMAGGVLN